MTSTLTGLSLTGASFLVNVIKNSNEKEMMLLNSAKKFFIKAFFMFLITTLMILTFDVLQVFIQSKVLVSWTVIDVCITMSTFIIGVFFLIRSARILYKTFGKTGKNLIS